MSVATCVYILVSVCVMFHSPHYIGSWLDCIPVTSSWTVFCWTTEILMCCAHSCMRILFYLYCTCHCGTVLHVYLHITDNDNLIEKIMIIELSLYFINNLAIFYK